MGGYPRPPPDKADWALSASSFLVRLVHYSCTLLRPVVLDIVTHRVTVRYAGGVYWLFTDLRHFKAWDLLFKLHCLAVIHAKQPERQEFSILARGINDSRVRMRGEFVRKPVRKYWIVTGLEHFHPAKHIYDLINSFYRRSISNRWRFIIYTLCRLTVLWTSQSQTTLEYFPFQAWIFPFHPNFSASLLTPFLCDLSQLSKPTSFSPSLPLVLATLIDET